MILSLESEDYRMKFRLDKRKESNLRVDDTEEAVENRISSFQTSTMSVIDQFQGHSNVLHRVSFYSILFYVVVVVIGVFI